MRLFVRSMFMLVLLAGLSLNISAQSFTASVRGVVSDQSAATVPGAKITVTDVDRNTTSMVTADSAGRYAFNSLPPGNYTLVAEAAGFKKFSSGKFTLAVQQQADH